MPSPLDQPEVPTPTRTPDNVAPADPSLRGSAKTSPLAIENKPSDVGESSAELTKMDLGGGTVVKLDKLGPMIVNSDGTLSRIQNWQDLHPIEQERTVRLLVKKRNLVRLQSLEKQEETSAQAASGEEELTILKESRS